MTTHITWAKIAHHCEIEVNLWNEIYNVHFSSYILKQEEIMLKSTGEALRTINKYLSLFISRFCKSILTFLKEYCYFL